jgi:hypothetical protein
MTFTKGNRHGAWLRDPEALALMSAVQLGKEHAGTPHATTVPRIRDLAWAAGFLEGEGCFAHDPKFSRSMVAAVQVQAEPLYRLAVLFGGHVKSRNNKAGKFYAWNIYGARARGVSLTLYPMMSPKRQAAIRRLRGGYDYFRG